MMETIEEEIFIEKICPFEWYFDRKLCMFSNWENIECDSCENLEKCINYFNEYDEMLEDFRNNIWTM